MSRTDLKRAVMLACGLVDVFVGLIFIALNYDPFVSAVGFIITALGGVLLAEGFKGLDR